MTGDGAIAQVPTKPRPVGIVRDGVDGSVRDHAPALLVGGGVVLGAAFAAWAIAARRRRRRGGPRGEDAPVAGALPTLARAMKIGRAEVRVLKRLAEAAKLREPAVLLISEYAFRDAAAQALSAAPEAAESVASLAASLGYTLDDAARAAEHRGGVDDGAR